MDNIRDKWRLICPPKNWRQPIALDDEDLDLVDQIARRLDLVLKAKRYRFGPGTRSNRRFTLAPP